MSEIPDRVRRHPFVRRAAGAAHRLAPTARRLRRSMAPLERAQASTWLSIAALRSRAGVGRRRTALERGVVSTGSPVGSGRRLALVTLPDGVEDARTASACDDARILVAEDPGSRRSRRAGVAATAAGADVDVLCFFPGRSVAGAEGWADRLVEALGEGVVAATPTLVHPERSLRHATEHDLLVRSAGYTLALDGAGAPVASARRAGRPVEVGSAATEVDGAPLTGLVVDRAAYDAVGGLPAIEDDDVAALELCALLRRAGGRILHVPAAVALDPRPVRSRSALVHPVDVATPAWREFVERHGPEVSRHARPVTDRSVRWVITTAAPTRRVADRWGDWHFAGALARSLRDLGHDVRVQTLDLADSLAGRSCDLHLVLRGLGAVRRTAGQGHVLWVISHPEAVDIAECDAADLVLVASERFADHLRARTSTPVEVLLQATDATRFHPQPATPEHVHPVTVVAKTRGVMRRVVADALDAGIRPAIYGGGWQGLVDPTLVVADHVDNRDLASVYSSAGVVLNDHWDTMRDWGFVSNRLFDVLACGAPVISDEVEGIAEVFGDAVPTYRTSAELGSLVADALGDPAAARARAMEGRALVLAQHTFAHRARRLVDLVDGLGLVPPGR